MDEFITSSKEFDLDLAFTGASKKVLSQIPDVDLATMLSEAKFWEKDLKEWIQYIRNDELLFCPELVRSAPVVTMGLQFTDDSTIAALNSSWRCKPETTDVLSFAVFDEDIYMSGCQFIELGDIVVSVTRAEQQAQQQNHSLLHELRWLVSHGLLHLLGWDHPTAEKLNEMIGCQEQLLGVEGNLEKIEKKNVQLDETSRKT
ncbi:MAG: rRNA maturation RNase YbeY [Prochlorococcaceae cyanobacterium ETNP1_MAG_9]|nr:rRNA maturation RNase YbeY [Prochlorococcaceae cyanobacterium ETNP1_MAG_9]